jgi:ribosomal protein L11 methyltransferase
MGALPYETLFIYELTGEIFGSRHFFKEDFIGCWNEGGASFLFFSAPHDAEVDAFTKKRGTPLVSKNIMDYAAWQAGEELKPFKEGNLVFCPPWEKVDLLEREILVYLDPCVVFGTGFHPTTRCCLKALHELYRNEKPKRVLDLGTGTGILALAASKWGAETVLAVDCNELAADTAHRNVDLNRETSRIEVRTGKAEEAIDLHADLVCANLHAPVIESLMERESFYEKRWILLSGLFLKDAARIEEKLSGRSIVTWIKIVERNWSTRVGKNESLSYENCR